MHGGRIPFRRGALLIAAAFVVHQLRFTLVYGADAARVLHEPGHEYLSLLAVAVVLMLVAAAIHFASSLLRPAARPAQPGLTTPRLHRLWIENSALLVAIYFAQESTEGAFTAGHPVLSHGGWVVFPLALVFGGLVGLLLLGADRALDERASPWLTTYELPVAELARLRRPVPRSMHRDTLARHLSGRAPPAYSGA